MEEISQSRELDVDFSDVFGGPPRRSSTQDSSHSFEDNNDVEDEGKPVFGEAVGVRRRYTSDDFYDDIFRGDQPSSSSQSPRGIRRRNPFSSSAPSSRVMSPSRSLPPPEPFATPTNFSLPSRVTNADFTASTSMNQSSFNPSLSRFNQTIQNHDIGYHSSSRPSALPRQDSADTIETTSGSQLHGIGDQIGLHSNAKGSDYPNYTTNFHFSIYKWASKGVPLVISLRKRCSRSKETTKLNRCWSDSEKGVKDDLLLSENHDIDILHIPVTDALSSMKSVTPLSSFLNDNSEGNEKEKSTPSDDVSSHKVDNTKVHKSSPATKKDASETTGKVKDFVKIFNQEFPSKTSGPRLRQSHSRRWKDTKTIEVDYEIRFSSARMDDETEASYVNWGETCPDTSEMDDGNSRGSHQFKTPNADRLRDSVPKNIRASDDDILGKEATKGYETKVSQWSKGKEGNIRALLSTLQYVLWPESGWKPIPLVDIIDANAVKRAYQKALLRLHPDKLQQKGADLHHKLIAEKVFDILQEAWDQFNSLGSL